MVGERQLRAGGRALATNDHPRALRPAREVQAGERGDLPVGASGAVLIHGADPVPGGDLEDRGAHRLGEVVADGEPDVCLVGPGQELVAGAGGNDTQQDLDLLDVLVRDLLQRRLRDGDLVDRGVRPGVPGRNTPASDSRVSSQ